MGDLLGRLGAAEGRQCEGDQDAQNGNHDQHLEEAEARSAALVHLSFSVHGFRVVIDAQL
jgi:hypothetical protein